MRRTRRHDELARDSRILAMLTIALVVLISFDQNAVLAQTPFGASRVSPETGFMGWLLAQQAVFYRALSGAVRLSKTDGSALWTLMGIAFAYGVFHAAGPGHGKAVISSYLLANDETWRRGIALSFASALLQSLTAVLIVGVAAALLGATARKMSDAARTIELISYGLIVLLGARLLWVKGLGFIRALAEFRDHRHHRADDAPGHHPPDAHAHHAHHDNPHDDDQSDARQHDHSHTHGADHEPGVLPWGHAHGPEPQDLEGPGGWRRGLSAIVAVGLRPCSGAIILLVFALSQGLFWAGAASTFVMGLGTAITVAAIATLAVGARTFAIRFARDEISIGSLLVRGMEVGAAGLILAFGALLLAGYMASERLAFF